MYFILMGSVTVTDGASSLIMHLMKTMCGDDLRGRGVLFVQASGSHAARAVVVGEDAGQGFLQAASTAGCQAVGRACRATVGACDGCPETRHGEGSARTDPEAEAHIAGPISRQRREYLVI